MELTAEKQQGIVKDSTCPDQQILVDPETNMLVHVSKDGMVLEPIDEQPTFIGEFVEESEEPEMDELLEEEPSDVNPSALYMPVQEPSGECAPSDIGLGAGPSNDTSAPVLEEELVIEEEMPMDNSVLIEDHSVSAAEIEKSEKSSQSFTPKRMVNILKRTLPVRLPRVVYK
ncbi:hypothetical protein OESDEN_17459 [Oesophagostomum dentatum]|uniref:Uncharacterized protein n=1 Tax=Oesophagostomum dentatum TaxID=61180 RepID=A0A0B1SG22_OESDE|nr:hypothetical protein OESDEN_17459 [Oesophagostomum dentatum]